MNDDADARIVDARGMRCPWPALRLARAAREEGAGRHLILLGDDPNAAAEVQALTAARGWRVRPGAERFDVWT